MGLVGSARAAVGRCGASSGRDALLLGQVPGGGGGGWSVSAIARHLGRDRKTIRRYLSGAGALVSDVPPALMCLHRSSRTRPHNHSTTRVNRIGGRPGEAGSLCVGRTTTRRSLCVALAGFCGRPSPRRGREVLPRPWRR